MKDDTVSAEEKEERFFEHHEAFWKCVSTCEDSRDRIAIIRVVVKAIDAAINLDRCTPEFFSFRDLENRWGLERKAIERLSLHRTYIGKTVRFSRADVLDFERGTPKAPE